MISPSPRPFKPLLRVLEGEALYPPPVWLMRQAGRFLPEFRKEREKADFLTRCLTPEIAAELTLQPIRRFGMDGAILFSDILILPNALGQKLSFGEGQGPILEPVRSRKEIDFLRENLDSGQAMAFMAPVREALKCIRPQLPNHTALVGFAGSPFTVSCYMVEGRGSRDFCALREFMLQEKALYDALMEILTEGTISMLRGQIDAGAEAVMLFDSWAGILPPDDFRDYVIAPTRKIRAALEDSHPHIRVIGFPRLAGLMIGEYAEKTGVNAVGCDTSMDLEKIRRIVPETLALQGNLDPAILLAGGERLASEARKICESLKSRPHIFNLGHGVNQFTPVEHVEKLVSLLRKL